MDKLSKLAYAKNPKNVEFRDQRNGEEILFLLRGHPLTNLCSFLIFLFLLVTPFLLRIILKDTMLDFSLFPSSLRILLFMLWYLGSLGYALLSFLNWFFNIYLITNRRIVDLDYFGFLFYRLSEAELSQIQDVTYSVSGLLSVLFNFGDILVQTAAEHREFDFIAVPNPAEVHDIVTDLAEERD
ncbi:MAG: PH domain-containing protein [Patescibacteria group bacterium]